MVFLLFRYLAITAIAVLVACETPVKHQKFPDQTFQHLPKLLLDVREIKIVRLYTSPFQRPHVEHEMPISPQSAVERWVHDRLQTTGTNGLAIVTIRTASVIETQLKKMGGIRGAFTREQSERYDAKVEVDIEVMDGKGLKSSKASASSLRSKTIPENATLHERLTVWYNLTEKVMKEFGRTFEIEIRKHLSPFLK